MFSPSQDNLSTPLALPFLLPFSAHLLLKASSMQAVQLFCKHASDGEDIALTAWWMNVSYFGWTATSSSLRVAVNIMGMQCDKQIWCQSSVSQPHCKVSSISRLLRVFFHLPLPSHMVDSFERKSNICGKHYATSTVWGSFHLLQLVCVCVCVFPLRLIQA